MTATQSLKIYELINSQFQKPEVSRQLTEAIESVIDEKVEGGKQSFQQLLNKDIEVLRSDLRTEIVESRAELRTEIERTKSELARTIYVVGIVQFLGIIGGLLAIVMLFVRR